MTILPLLSLSGYFLFLAEFIAMRHRDICAESDARIGLEVTMQIFSADYCKDIDEAEMAEELYWNRGTK